ncbi:MAG: 3-hydroxyacyl-CoA dehydrogenase NAD-binding domain-containing protein [Pseudomonadota bacterium]
MFDTTAEDLHVGVLGAGAMGRGIAQVALAGGCRVTLVDAQRETADEAQAFIAKMLTRAAEKGQMDEAAAQAGSALAAGGRWFGSVRVLPCRHRSDHRRSCDQTRHVREA